MAMLFSVMSFAAETVAYTLTPAATGGNSSPHNAYASAADWTYEGITWNVTGNSYMVPWRIGGKSITAQDRAVYTKTAMAADITKIEITHATVNITCNSCTLTVSDAANGAGETFPVKVAQNTTTTITLPEGDYSNKFYKLVYNVTNSTTSNKYVQLSEIKFYTEVQTSVEAPTFTPEEGKVAANNTFAEPFALTIASATTDATIKYTLDGTDPTLETALTYEAPITISTMVQVRAIAVKGEEKSVEASVAYIISSSEAKPYTASEAIAAEALGLTGTVYVTGTVKSIEELSTQYGNATYNITDGTKELKIYRGKNLENAKFTSADQLLVGDVVVVKGDLTSYNGAAQLGQNNYLISRSTPVINHTITVSANPAEAGTVTGGGEFEETDEITVKAVANEGYEFVNWTENEVEVSTDAEYTFEVLADRALVANFKKAEPELAVMDIEMTNLVVQEMEGFLVLTASDDDNTGLNVMLALNADGTLNTEVSYMALIQSWNEVELPIVEGAITKTYNEELATDVYTGLIVVEYMEGKLGLNLTMYAKPVVVTDVVVTDATITVETGDDGMGGTYEIINVTANWNESVLKLEGVEKEFEGFLQITETFVVDGEEDWYIWMCMNGVITTVDNVLTVTGEFKNNYTGDVYNVTISGKLPVVEPTTITYELNGGEIPAVVVPTNAELWEAFKPYYNTYYGLARADQPIDKVSTFAAAKMQEIMTDEASEYKWLGDYVLNVAAGQGVNLPTDMAAANEGAWRWAVHAFFNATTGANGAKGTDFTEAGKPEAWGAAYEAEYGVVLPTEPVAEDYTLPTPTKEGYTFVGWYDNAEGTGEAYKVIPAGWAGTLYAIWKQDTTTALDNIAVEGKAVKAIINGQVLIMIGDKTFNMMGQQVK